MAVNKPKRTGFPRNEKLGQAIEALTALEFSPKQRNRTAAYTLLSLLNLQPGQSWAEADAPLRGITPIIDFIRTAYGVRYAPNTRETIRDEAMKYFVAAGLVLRNPDAPGRPTNSGNTVYQIESSALNFLRKFGTKEWGASLAAYLAGRSILKSEIDRTRNLARIPVTLPDGSKVALSPGGQNSLIKAIIEQFCPAFSPGGAILYIGDTENKFVHLEAKALQILGVVLSAAAKMPDIIERRTGFCSLRPSQPQDLWMESAGKN